LPIWENCWPLLPCHGVVGGEGLEDAAFAAVIRIGSGAGSVSVSGGVPTGSAIQVHSFARCPKKSVPAGSSARRTVALA
jgi:hypothetical protein